MVVPRTAPQQSWTNPAERIMSILKLGLQGCALSRTEMDKDFEITMRKCNGMSAIQWAATSSQEVAIDTQMQQSQGQVPPPMQEVNDVNVQLGEPLTEALPTNFPAADDYVLLGNEAISIDSSAVSQTLDIILPAVPSGEHLELPFVVPIRTDEELTSNTDDDDQSSQSSSVCIGEDEPRQSERQPDIGVQPPSREDAASNDRVPRESYSAIPVYSKGNFEEVYVASIQNPLMIVENQFFQLRWNETPVEIHPPATGVEV